MNSFYARRTFLFNRLAKSLFGLVIFSTCISVGLTTALGQSKSKDIFHAPFRIQADGETIVIGKGEFAHAGPCIADVNCDGVKDLLVGSFSGNFWLFKNTGSDSAPVYTAKGKLQAGDEDAIVPIY